MDKIIYIAGILFVAEFLLVVGLIAYIYFRARYLHRKREKKLLADKKKEEYVKKYFDAINESDTCKFLVKKMDEINDRIDSMAESFGKSIKSIKDEVFGIELKCLNAESNATRKINELEESFNFIQNQLNEFISEDFGQLSNKVNQLTKKKKNGSN